MQIHSMSEVRTGGKNKAAKEIRENEKNGLSF